MKQTLSASTITRLHEPSSCSKRTWLHDVKKLEPAPGGPFAEFLAWQGLRHEEQVVARLQSEGFEIVDLDGIQNENAFSETVDVVRAGGNVVYQGMLEAETEIDGQTVCVIGYPDLLIPAGERWIIADAKLARGLFKDNGKERTDREAIFLQLRLYGWLFEQVFPGLAFTLRAYNGAGGIENVEPDGGVSPLAELERVLQLRSLTEEPHEVVGWSKCGVCGYKDYCWPTAEEEKALGLVIDIDQKLAPKLEAEGITSYPELRERFDAIELAKLKSQEGDNVAGARRILENIEALEAGKPVRRRDDHGDPIPIDKAVTADATYVMFDLEGVPPELEQAERVYLWGMQLFGEESGAFIDALAGFGDDGDESGWRDFLEKAAAILENHPEIRFVHWADYEKTMLKNYLERYGDDAAGTGARVRAQLLDLLPITKAAVALPLPSYSLKVVEQSDAVFEETGFKRTADDVAKGDESIAAYMEAVETKDMSRREEIVAAIRAYNQEDLEATWAVMKWLRSF